MTHDALVRACVDLIAEHGVAALSLRKLADRVGIKAPSIYAHFPSKEALLAEASREASAALGEFLRQGCRGDDARERLLSTAMGYLRFADAQPSLFALFFMELQSVRRSLDDLPDKTSPYGFLIGRVSEFLGGSREQAEFLGFGIWSLVHGAAVLRQTHLRDFSGPIGDAIQQNLERLLDGWRPAPASAPTAARGGPGSRGMGDLE
jgi:AcrR family transcriptional regulator